MFVSALSIYVRNFLSIDIHLFCWRGVVLCFLRHVNRLLGVWTYSWLAVRQVGAHEVVATSESGCVCWAGGRLMLSVWIDRPLPACWVARSTSETNLARQVSTTLVKSVGQWLGRVRHVTELSLWAKKHASWSASDSCSCWSVWCWQTVRCVSSVCRGSGHWVMVKSAHWLLLLYGFFTAHARYENLSISFAFSHLMFGDTVNCKVLHKVEVTKVSQQSIPRKL